MENSNFKVENWKFKKNDIAHVGGGRAYRVLGVDFESGELYVRDEFKKECLWIPESLVYYIEHTN